MKRKRVQSFANTTKANNNPRRRNENHTLRRHEEKQELLDNLDFIVALGNQIHERKVKQNTWLLKLNNSTGLFREEEETMISTKREPAIGTVGLMEAKDANGNQNGGGCLNHNKNKAVLRVVSHVEDPLLYSDLIIDEEQIEWKRWNHKNNENALFNWPLKKKQHSTNISSFNKNDCNYYWNMQYGDGLKDENVGCDACYYDNGDIGEQGRIKENTATSNTNEKLFHDILRKAWERAVDVASTTIVSNHNVQSIKEENTNNDDNADHGDEIKGEDGYIERRRRRQQQKRNYLSSQSPSMNQVCTKQVHTILKCKSLGITFDDIHVSNDDHDDTDTGHHGQNLHPTFTCTSCKKIIPYTSKKAVLQHIYGGKLEDEEDNQDEGCAWSCIRRKQNEMVKQILEKKGIQTIDALLHILFTNASKKRYGGIPRDDDDFIKRRSTNTRKPKTSSSSSPPCQQSLNWMDVLFMFKNEIQKEDEIKEQKRMCTNYVHNNNANGGGGLGFTTCTLTSIINNVRTKHNGFKSDLVDAKPEYIKTMKNVNSDGSSNHKNKNRDVMMIPLTMNKNIYEIVLRRLIDRYGNNYTTE